MTEIRLQKILAERGICSRRAAERYILEGRVKVNGETVFELGTKADPEKDEIMVSGNTLRKKKVDNKYYLLHKPSGYITSASDERGRRTVLDLVPKGERLYPVGRLDYNTSGLLLMTNDGNLTNGLLHPRGEVDKVYRCAVTGEVTNEKMAALREGVRLEDGITSPARAKTYTRRSGEIIIEITIHEGRNRQVRRMMSAIGLEVNWLKRIGFAGLVLDEVPTGSYRELNDIEIETLYRIAGLKKEIQEEE